MTTRKIEFYRMRDFGQKLNATIEFIRTNFGKFFLSLLLIAGPAALIMGLAMKDFMATAFRISVNQPGDPDAVMSMFGLNYFLMIGVSIFLGVMLSLTCYSYMELYRSREVTDFSVTDVFRNAISRFGAAFVLLILIAITVFISFFFFMLPALYFSVALSLALPILFFEKVGPIEAYKRSFRLISEKWWSTFGILVVSAIISYVAAMIFSVPFYGVYIFEVFSLASNVDEPDPSSFINMFSSWYMAASMIIMMIGSYLSYAIVIVALSFQYFNLAERANAYGLIDKIQDLENIK